MPIRTEKHISRAMLRAEPETLWVFGDNLPALWSKCTKTMASAIVSGDVDVR